VAQAGSPAAPALRQGPTWKPSKACRPSMRDKLKQHAGLADSIVVCSTSARRSLRTMTLPRCCTDR